ncbi:MAG: type II toxin-antitoxin system RelB/DinJ family antitoxin [bacterium]
MGKTDTVRARIEPSLKSSVDVLFKRLGITATEAITMFYSQIKLRNGLPFNVVVPNETTEKTFKDTDAKRNLFRCDDTGDMFEKLNI